MEMIMGFISTKFAYETDPILNVRHINRISNITRFVDFNMEHFTSNDMLASSNSCGLCCTKATNTMQMREHSFSSSSSSNSDSSKSSSATHRSNHESFLEKMTEDVREQFSLKWKRAELLIKPMINLSFQGESYSCYGVNNNNSKCIKWRPNRDEVGETRVTSFRLAILAFWTRIVGIHDHDLAENDIEAGRIGKPFNVDVFKNLFIDKIQPFLIKKWKLFDTCKELDQEKINSMFISLLRVKYSHALHILKSSFGSKTFFGRFSSDPVVIERLENEHLPYIAFMAEEIMYPITSYTDHGFLCYAYLNQRLVLSNEYDKVLYETHLSFTLALHRALVLLKLADINSLTEMVPEEKQCTRFFYRTLTLPGEKDSFDPYQLRLSLQNTSFSTHPIGALLVFQTVWCIRLRDNPGLVRTMIVNPTDARLSRVAGLSKHPSEFEVIVPSFSEYIISVDPNVIHDNNVGWTEMINMFKKFVMKNDDGKKFEQLFSRCGNLVRTVLNSEYDSEDQRNWMRRNVPNYAKTVKCMYETISDLASTDGVSLVSIFVPDLAIVDHLNADKNIKRTETFERLLKEFKGLMIETQNGEKVSIWTEIEKQFFSAYTSTSQLRDTIDNEYAGDVELYILEYLAKLCVELWWFNFKFVDEQLQRRGILSRPATIAPHYFYAVIFSFGIIIHDDSLENENYSLDLSTIAEGTTSLIGIDNEGWVWKLYKTENACREPKCPCDKRDIFSVAKHEHEISSVLHSNNSRKEDENFVESHFIEAVLAGHGRFNLIEDGRTEISFLKMKKTEGDTFSQFVFKNHTNETEILSEKQMKKYMKKTRNIFLQGLEILEFLKRKQIIHMDFHESNGILNINEAGEINLVLIDFGLSECYDEAFHEKGLVLLKDKSYLPTIGKGRFAVSEIFSAPYYVHDLQIFCTRFIENGILGMSSRLPNIFDRRREIGTHFPGFGKYFSFVKDILESNDRKETSFLVQISEILLLRSRDFSTLTDKKSLVALKSFSYKLYLNMKAALIILKTPKLTKFFNIWIQIYFVDSPEKIRIRDENNFPTSYSLLEALKNTNGSVDEASEKLAIVIENIQKFVNISEEAFVSVKGVYGSFIDREPGGSEKIGRIVKQLLDIRRKEVTSRSNGGLIRADPIPRMFVSCQGSYNPPTKAHLFLAHEGRKRALEIYSQNHSEDEEMIECNEDNIFGILSTIDTFEVMIKDYPEQSFTVEERQGILRSLTGSKLVNFVSGDSPYDKYNDWGWLLFDYSGHSGGQIKNSSKFLAEAETIDLIFLITFANFEKGQNNSRDWDLSEDIYSKLVELRLNYESLIPFINQAHEMLVRNEIDLAVNFRKLNTKAFETGNDLETNRHGIFLNENHLRYIENVFRELLIQEDRLSIKGNYRLFAISGEPKNSNNKDLYLGMADSCPRNLNLDSKSFNVSSTNIRRFMYNGEGIESLEFLDDFVAERINQLHAIFDFVGNFELEPSKHSEFAAKFLGRSYLTESKELKHAIPKLSHIPPRRVVFRESYTPSPITVKKLTMFLEFDKPDELDQSPFYITGVFNMKWNEFDYPNGYFNISNLLSLDGRSDFIKVLDIKLLDMTLQPEYFITDEKLTFTDEFIKEILGQTNEFRILIKAQIRPLGLNRSGRGLYLSGKQKEEQMALTLMEPFGFSNLFFMQDRPDVLSLYDIIMLNYPHKHTLLAGGDSKKMGLYEYLEMEKLNDLKESTRDQNITLFSDQQVKPTYLFQLIMLPYESEQELETSGKIRHITRGDVDIRLVRETVNQLDDTSFALESLTKVMEFDEKFSGHYYDSKNLTLVAATDFNSGAREMRNFMVFSPSKLLANERISTIDDFYNVERIVAHEYLHHVSGNRVTMRDFFEVTLKEGLTVLRDMYFRENGGIFGQCSRIEAVTKLRKTQWVQDSGPKAHSVRPDSIEHKGDFEVSLFTTTVYEKGAEIMRMIQTMIEPDVKTFSRMLNNYLSGPIRPSTIDELVDSFHLEQNIPYNWFSKRQFMKWFLVKGTPSVTFNFVKTENGNRWTLNLRQLTVNGNDSKVEEEMMIPIRIGFFNEFGKEIKNDRFEILHNSGIEWLHGDLFVLHQSTGILSLQFDGNSSEIIPSINRGFSAPIKIEYVSNYRASFLAKFETDPISRFDALQFLMKSGIYSIYQGIPVRNLVKEICGLVKFRFSRITNSLESNVFDYWTVSRLNIDDPGKEQEKLELALSIEEMYLSNLVEDFDVARFGPVDPVKLSESREKLQNWLSEELFNPETFVGNQEFIKNELDPLVYPGTVKLDQVLLRTYLSSRQFADSVSQSDDEIPSMERKMALLECRYRLSSGPSDRTKLLEDFNAYVNSAASGHAVAKEKLFKFVILKSKTAQELKEFIEKFDLLVPTQPQNLKLFAKEFASNNLSVFHDVDGLKLMADVIINCDRFGNHETAATLIKHSFEVNLLKLNQEAQSRVASQLKSMLEGPPQLSKKLENSIKSLLKQLSMPK